MTGQNKKLESKNIIVVGASRGLGKGIALRLAQSGANVTAIGRNIAALETLSKSNHITVHPGDATDPTFIAHLLGEIVPDSIVLVAGAKPALLPISQYNWESFCFPWNTDVKATFHWLQAALQRELMSHMIVFSSGAALQGSPLSGGYAGAKQTQRFLCQYASDEAAKRKLMLRIQCILPQLNPNTSLGAAAVKAYARAAGEQIEEFVKKRFGNPLTPEIAGESIVRLLTEDELIEESEFLLTGKGLQSLKK